jgi:hypothetical protein
MIGDLIGKNRMLAKAPPTAAANRVKKGLGCDVGLITL